VELRRLVAAELLRLDERLEPLELLDFPRVRVEAFEPVPDDLLPLGDLLRCPALVLAAILVPP
jgi:hypothetical protein